MVPTILVADHLLWPHSVRAPPDAASRCTQAKLVPPIVANYLLGPAAHFINFRFVPTEHRILYNNCVSVRSSRIRVQGLGQPGADPQPADVQLGARVLER